MKKSLIFAFGILLIGSLVFIGSCKTDDPEPEGGTWTEADKQSHDQVLTIQDEVGDNLDDWFQTMDSLDAIQQAYQAFVNSEYVSSATINNKGIAVQYTNGMRGGLFLTGKHYDYKKSTILGSPPDDFNSEDNLKSLVTSRKMLQMDAAYSEFSYYTNQVHNKHVSNLSRVGISVTEFLKDEQVTLDRLTQLAGYGIIDMSSHGVAWPKETNVTDVYYLTGETVSANSSKKYWDDLKTGNIPVMKVWKLGRTSKYFVSPEFITNHNDFSNDTVLFFGGFCYSFLGGWPDIVDAFGDGAYLGFTWSVQGFHCANWDVNSIALLSDTAKEQPVNLETWMNDPGVEKSYWDEADQKTVSIHYAGDGNLKLWDDVSVSLQALSTDGKPVSSPGEAGVAYPFRCSVITTISPLEYVWDIGDGSSPVKASNEVNITWSDEGQYELKVDVKDKSSGSIIGSASAEITIGSTNEEELIDFVKKCTFVSISFGPTSAFLWEEGKSLDDPDDPGDWEWEYAPLSWNGLNFSATYVNDQNQTQTINGVLSGDGYTVSAVGEQEGHEIYGGFDFAYKLGFENYPVRLPLDPIENRTSVSYSVENSSQIQNYVTTFEGKMTWENGHIVNYTGVNWDELERLIISFHWLPVESLE